MRLGGVSDPRNGLVMKMFSLIDVGERAGTGVPDVFATWANACLLYTSRSGPGSLVSMRRNTQIIN